MGSYRKTRGFTLIELSIVLIIIALITAAVLAGQELEQQGKLQSVVNQIARINSASRTFEIKYGYLPGDIPNAFDFWGASCDATPSNCNGNADQIIQALDTGVNAETYRLWQHLTLAGLLEGEYTGVAAVGTRNCVLDSNTPPAAYESSGFFQSSTRTLYTNGAFQWVNGYSSVLGKCAGTDVPNTALFVPKEAKAIDTKIDNGYPNIGSITTNTGLSASGTCQTTTSAQGNYNVGNNGIACYMMFLVK
jgi:prepilin-type N-terminal cleavage/methylation domain-containing protein